MYNIKLISILSLVILLNISCKSSSSFVYEKKIGFNYYLYGLGNSSDSDSPDPNTICQYRCTLDPDLKLEQACERYYLQNIDKLDKTTLELVQNPTAPKISDEEKTFKLKSLYDLLNHKDVIKDNYDHPRCNFMPYSVSYLDSIYSYEDRYKTRLFFIWLPVLKNNLFFNVSPASVTITEEGKNETWSKCTASFESPYLRVGTTTIENGLYCRKNESGGYQLLYKPPRDEDYMSEDPFLSPSEKENFLKKYILPNLEYLELKKEDCIDLNSRIQCISLGSGFTFNTDEIPIKPTRLLLYTVYDEKNSYDWYFYPFEYHYIKDLSDKTYHMTLLHIKYTN